MPFYEYECRYCGKHEEVLQAIGEKPLKKCSSCGKAGLKKLISAPVFRLKGSGWYETDFKSDKENKRNLAGAEKEEPKADDKKAETKPDAGTPEKSEKPEKAKAAEPAPVKTRAAGAAKRPTAPKRKPAHKGRR